MKIVLDESVSYGLAEVLRHEGHEIIAIAESETSGNSDNKLSCHPPNSSICYTNFTDRGFMENLLCRQFCL